MDGPYTSPTQDNDAQSLLAPGYSHRREGARAWLTQALLGMIDQIDARLRWSRRPPASTPKPCIDFFGLAQPWQPRAPPVADGVPGHSVIGASGADRITA